MTGAKGSPPGGPGTLSTAGLGRLVERAGRGDGNVRHRSDGSSKLKRIIEIAGPSRLQVEGHHQHS